MKTLEGRFLPDWCGWQASLVYWTVSCSPSDCLGVLQSKKNRQSTCKQTHPSLQLENNAHVLTFHQSLVLLVVVQQMIPQGLLKMTTKTSQCLSRHIKTRNTIRVFNWVSEIISRLLWFCIDWLKNLAPLSQPIRSKTKSNRNLLARV